jgi:nucleotide-binding universal stress UspA family protein
MTEHRDDLGDHLQLAERARETDYFRKLDPDLMAKRRQQVEQEAARSQRTASRSKAFRTVLIPVDFSPYAVRALETAADIAERFASHLTVLHVIHPDVGAIEVAEQLSSRVPASRGNEADLALEALIDKQRDQAYAALEAFLLPRLVQHPIELRVVFGRPFERIVETAVQDRFDLIVMGTHGRTGIARVALGSVAERVVRLAPCAVLTVKATTESDSWLKEFYETYLGIKTE